jgi:uncharacterized repeat protein (TIGR03806 family)
MIMKWIFLFLSIVLFVSTSLRFRNDKIERKDKLSEYGFFRGRLSDLTPDSSLLFYDVNTPLFSNYAEKLRFVRLPRGKAATYRDSVAFDLPVGTILIKNFFYPLDFRQPEKARRIMETRLLVHQQNGWEAWPYIWNDDQSEAFYDPAGETRTVSYVDSKGRKKTTLYAIPNKNQCKGCHISKNTMLPIGVNARQLNRDIDQNGKSINQLDLWVKNGMLSGLSASQDAQRMKVWNDPASGSLDERARAYLDANCGHCHSQNGPANTSGLFLDIFESRAVHLGINKTPVAAGRGAGNLKYDIVPGSPDQSILLFRMKTTDPAIAMPEIGREQVHAEGVALIEEWIRLQRAK